MESLDMQCMSWFRAFETCRITGCYFWSKRKHLSFWLTSSKFSNVSKKKSFHESNYTLVVVFRLNFLKNSQKVNKNTEKVNSNIMVDELLLAINPEYSVRSNLTFSAADLYLENNNINYNIVYIRVLHCQSIT